MEEEEEEGRTEDKMDKVDKDVDKVDKDKVDKDVDIVEKDKVEM